MKKLLVLFAFCMSATAFAKPQCDSQAQQFEGWNVACHPVAGQLSKLDIPRVTNGMHFEDYQLCFAGPYYGNVLAMNAYQQRNGKDVLVGKFTCFKN